MEKLEQAKANLPNEDALLDDTAASAYCEQFALQTFAKGEREMAENRANGATADTLLAASTFLETLSIWKKDSDPEIASKTKFAKYHALRIVKALKAGEDPNLTNPVQEQPEILSPPDLDPSDPEVQRINQGNQMQPPQNPYQSYVESAPNTDVQPSPTFSAPQLSPPPQLPSAPTGYTQNSHNDVSPMSQPASSRQGSVVSVGGGYFPKTDAEPPTFTAEPSAPGLTTVPSIDNDPLTSSLPTSPQVSQAPSVSDAASFYQNAASPAPTAQAPQQPPQNPYQQPQSQQPQVFHQQQQHQYTAPAPHPPPQQPRYSSPSQQNPYAQPAAPPPPPAAQGPLRTDEDSIMEATKHAKWAISALNFEDSATAVKELRIALRALGAN
ncbi:hypothetical protein NX059_003815 [Plenodomus lindquistii]|nr:hypothetical protein NX059_003815 [Plenodomus lindquistii]